MSLKEHQCASSIPSSTLQTWNDTLARLKPKLDLRDSYRWQSRADLHSSNSCTCSSLYSFQNYIRPFQSHESFDRSLILVKSNIQSFQQNLPCLKYIGAFGVSCSSNDESQGSVCFLVQRLPEFSTVFSDTRAVEFSEPYVPGYLAFRHVEHFLAGLQRFCNYLPTSNESEFIYPQCLLVNGNGTLHDDQFGLACHLGVRTDLPTIGVSKTLYNLSASSRDEQRSAFESLSAGKDYLLIDESGRFFHPQSPDDTQNAIGLALKYCTYRSHVPIFIFFATIAI